jgi:hypothetical protein
MSKLHKLETAGSKRVVGKFVLPEDVASKNVLNLRLHPRKNV